MKMCVLFFLHGLIAFKFPETHQTLLELCWCFEAYKYCSVFRYFNKVMLTDATSFSTTQKKKKRESALAQHSTINLVVTITSYSSGWLDIVSRPLRLIPLFSGTAASRMSRAADAKNL